MGTLMAYVLSIVLHKEMGWAVQKLVNFNPGLSENSSNYFFFKKKVNDSFKTLFGLSKDKTF